MIPAEAVEAAVRTLPGFTPDEEADSYERETNDAGRAMVERILEAAAPYMRQAFFLEMNLRAVQDERSTPLQFGNATRGN